MGDHRVSDLLYGHLGEASYDPDEKSWSFSREPSQVRRIQLLLLPQECIPPSLLVPLSSTMKPSHTRYAQEKWLAKHVPEAAPAGAIVPFNVRPPERQDPSTRTTTLMAVGMAASIDSTHSKTIPIFAVAHGESGHVLRLIRPRVEDLGWNSHRGIRLRSLNPAASEETYWLGDGGTIQQIVFGTSSDGITPWLAVRKTDSTTILRPVHRRFLTAPDSSKDMGIRYPPSCLSPNPMLALQSKRTGGRPHADVSFNPWYIRQFAILDEQGNWSIWDIEGLQRKRTSVEASRRNFGHANDGLPQDEALAVPDNTDGWGRVLWAGGLSTIIICQRRRIAIFDLKAHPKRLYSPSLIASKSSDWIIDVKRSPIRLDQIFVLTSSQIFWLQIIAGEGVDQDVGHAGTRILLSCHHFRDEEDETMKLEIVNEDGVCVVFLYSSQDSLIRIYRFGNIVKGQTSPSCSEDSFVIPQALAVQCNSPVKEIQTLCVVPAPLKLNATKEISGPGKVYHGRGVRFYQLFKFSVNLALSCTLYASSPPISRLLGRPPKHLSVQAPTVKVPKVSKLSSALVVEDDFIVPDDLDDNRYIIDDADTPLVPAWWDSPGTVQRRGQNQLSMTFDARRLFKMAFFESQDKDSLKPHMMAERIEQVWNAVIERREHGLQGTSTLLELSGYSSVSEDVDEAASTLRTLMDSLLHEEENDSSVAVNLMPLPFLIRGGDDDVDSAKYLPHLSDIYDKMIECWVSCLPHQTPGQTRLAKERAVRDIATELCLSSLAVTIRDKSALFPEYIEPREGFDLTLPVRPRSNFGSQESRLGQVLHTGDTLGMDTVSCSTAPRSPTPTSTPGQIRKETAPSGTPVEDPSISRLRSYALSIKPQPPLGATASSILEHWPTTPGLDPVNYSWKAARKAIAGIWDEDSDEEDAINRRKEEERRRHRTEKFLKKQRANTEGTTSQPVPIISFGSQPDPVVNTTSSQPSENALLMTQPDRGAFGSRLGLKSWKKRRIKGF